MRRAAGFGLVEVLLALSLGLLLLLAGSRLFVAVLHSWQAQAVAAQLQEDARLALQRMARDIRMAGAFGCLRREAISFADPAIAAVFALPLSISLEPDGNLRSLSLVGAQSGDTGSPSNWTLVTDCVLAARAYAGKHLPAPDEFALPIHRQVYQVVAGQLRLSSGSTQAVLVDNVHRVSVDFGVADAAGQVVYVVAAPDPARIRSIRIRLTLADPQQRVRAQTYHLVAAVRSRVP
ncbi:PilW family protein [Pseudomonas aegrilactucae]|uniref:Prepilin-type N-terminal cleavage/methylation domain-containing protein n=1 Tax=Pseudomonas aegrilactucae TaxID=2854028 RepID=A0A9Q2XMV3_9PSED|nr:hypothetical protein [Pseudomonas aegrilactucae]MBV6289957.1 hypothetical protein [Pseudomonas aegrilactucae]